jgi:hypothetical protein
MVKRMDLIGVGLIIASLLLLNLGLTSKRRLFSSSKRQTYTSKTESTCFALKDATVYGWAGADFIAPFVIGVLLLPTFCLWEAKQDVRHAMLPVAIMKQGKFLVVCFAG